MSDWSTLLSPYPTGSRFNQNSAPTWDGQPAEGAGSDCGEQCITAQTFYTTGVYVPPDVIKDKLLGQGITGPTNINQLVGFLHDQCSIPTTVLTPTTTAGNAAGSLLNLEWAATNQGHAVFELRWWDHPVSGFYHWCVCIGLDPQTVYVFDPWTGTILSETYTQHRAMYVGAAVPGGGMFSCDRTRDSSLPT